VAATRPRERHYISYCRFGRVKGRALRFQPSQILTPVLHHLRGDSALEFVQEPESAAELVLAKEAQWNEEQEEDLDDN
jgi:hypothetical protein